jgi:pimeloyl-ACP methyl ester carboxylesterase
MVKKLGLLTLTSSIVMTLFLGCGDIKNENDNIVGENLLLTAESFNPIVDIPKEVLQAGFDAQAQATGTEAQKALLGIKSYKINYMTTDESGKKVKASGLITVPALTAEFIAGYKQQSGKDFTLSIVSDQHGTIFLSSEAPTKIAENGTPTRLSTSISGAALFMTVQPDYLGYGDSNGSHPYLLEKSSASVTVDMIKASIAFANKAGLPINGQVFLSGYSEGGYVTMAAAKEIEKNHPDINLMAIAPMAGPYDLNVTGMGILAPQGANFDTNMSRPDFIGGIVNSYAQANNFDLETILNDPFATTLPTLYDAKHSGEEIRAELTNSIQDFFLPSYRMDFLTNPNNALKQAFVDNTPLDWTPKTKVKLLHCTNDGVISPVLSQIAYAKLTANGSTSVELELIDTIPDNVLPSVHVICGSQTYKSAITWFSKIRTGEIK